MDNREFQQRMQRIEVLVQAVDRSSDSVTRESARELMQAVLELHAAGLQRLLDRISLDVKQACARDELVGNLLLLHGLHPLGIEERARLALDPLLGPGSEIEIVECSSDRLCVRVRAEDTAEWRRRVEEALVSAVPDLSSIEIVEESTSSRHALPLVHA